MIENRQLRIDRSQLTDGRSLRRVVEDAVGDDGLRWYVSHVGDQDIVVEATLYRGGVRLPHGDGQRGFHPGRDVVVSVVPTGIGCSIGGYAGDAAPATSLLAAATDYLVTNPNAVNASDFIALERNVLYTEGFCIDLLMQGLTDLYVPHGNRVGLIVERSAEADLDQVFNVVNAVRAVHGVDIVDVVVTEGAIGSHSCQNLSGGYVGTVDHPEELVRASEHLLARGAQAIAVTTNIQDLPDTEYAEHFNGDHPNPLGGVEAIISHFIVNRFGVPAAHAPLINCKDLPLLNPVVDARGAGEMASVSGLACVLVGLRRAPQLKPGVARAVDAVNVHNVVAVVAPASSLGGIPMLHAQELGIPVIAVEDNETILDVDQAAIGGGGILQARSYAEAAGLVLALRHGLSPAALRRPLTTMRHQPAPAAVAGFSKEWSDGPVAP